ncbi:hypothetical protein [Bradyrhizobium tunisiense]|jgi:hypothetical protein
MTISRWLMAEQREARAAVPMRDATFRPTKKPRRVPGLLPFE